MVVGERFVLFADLLADHRPCSTPMTAGLPRRPCRHSAALALGRLPEFFGKRLANGAFSSSEPARPAASVRTRKASFFPSRQRIFTVVAAGKDVVFVALDRLTSFEQLSLPARTRNPCDSVRSHVFRVGSGTEGPGTRRRRKPSQNESVEDPSPSIFRVFYGVPFFLRLVCSISPEGCGEITLSI